MVEMPEGRVGSGWPGGAEPRPEWAGGEEGVNGTESRLVRRSQKDQRLFTRAPEINYRGGIDTFSGKLLVGLLLRIDGFPSLSRPTRQPPWSKSEAGPW